MPISEDVQLGENVKIWYPDLINLYGCQIGAGTTIGPFVEIQRGVVVGRDCTISSHAFLCEGVTLGDRVFVGHGAKFCNEKFPVAGRTDWRLQDAGCIHVGRDVAIGTNATILPGVTIGHSAVIGAGAVVTKNVSPSAVAAGNPARILYYREN